MLGRWFVQLAVKPQGRHPPHFTNAEPASAHHARDNPFRDVLDDRLENGDGQFGEATDAVGKPFQYPRSAIA